MIAACFFAGIAGFTAGANCLPARSAAAQEPAGAVLLRNGEVLLGSVMPADDHYLVTQGPGASVRLRAADIAVVGRDLNDLYERQAATIPAGSVSRHLQLAEWCLRQQLLTAAERQCMQAKSADPRHPRLAWVEERIRLLRAAQANRPEGQSQGSIALKERSGAARLPAADAPHIQAASYEAEVEAPHGVPRDTLTEAAAVQFASTIQPILLNRCGAASCHGGNVESFRLIRAHRGLPLPKRWTERNLETTLAMIDPAAPDKSRLLTAAREPHGTQSVGALSDEDGQLLARLRAWITLAANQTEPQHATRAAAEIPADSHGPGGTAEPNGPDDPRGPGAVQPASFQSTIVDEESAQAAGLSRHALPFSAIVRGAANASRAVQRDPYDPAPFNERFHGAEQRAAAGERALPKQHELKEPERLPEPEKLRRLPPADATP